MSSLEPLLPYHSYDPEARLFVMRDGSLGVAWRLRPLETEAMSEEQLGQLAARFDALLRLVPVGAAAQILWRADRDVRTQAGAWRRATTRDGLYADLSDSRADALQKLHVTHDGAPVAARSIDLHFTLRVFPKYPRRRVEAAYAEHRRALLDRVNAVESLLLQAMVPFERLDADALLALAHRWLNACGEPPADRPDRLLSDRLCRSTFESEGGVVRVGGLEHRMLSAIEVPR